MKTAKGVSRCGGRVVTRVKGRFCGYCTSGRGPAANATSSALSSAALARLAKGEAATARVKASRKTRRRVGLLLSTKLNFILRSL
ncbi:hypothetical protein D3C76_1100680 [compost metagenome]